MSDRVKKKKKKKDSFFIVISQLSVLALYLPVAAKATASF